jgi:hypothetical protein
MVVVVAAAGGMDMCEIDSSSVWRTSWLARARALLQANALNQISDDDL